MDVDLDGFVVSSEPTGSPKFKLVDLEDWFSPPPSRTRVTELPGADGLFNPGRTWRSGKRMKLIGITYGVDAEHAEELAWEEIASLSPRGYSMLMTVTTHRGPRTMRVWLDSGQPQVTPFTPTSARFRIPLIAPDPRKYGPEMHDTAEPAGAATDGLTFPLFAGGYLDFGSFSPSGVFFITNNGRAESWPTFTVLGPIDTGFQIIAGDQSLQYNAGVATGTEVFLSPYAGGRAYVGSADVTTDLVVNGWPSVLPGETKQYVFNPLGTAGTTALLTWHFSEAWW